MMKIVLSNIDSIDSKKIDSLLSKSFPHASKYYKLWSDHIYNKHGKTDTYIVQENDNIIGLLNLMNRNNTAWLDLIAVDPEYQNLGIGSKLLEIAEEKAKNDFKSKFINLTTEASNIKNLNFYYDRGWIPSNIDKDGYGYSSAVLFKKILD